MLQSESVQGITLYSPAIRTRGLMMKKVQAFVAALIVTTLIGAGMFAVGMNAVANADSVSALAQADAAKTQPTTNVSTNAQSGTDAATQIAQLKSLIAQYQGREKQYQSQIEQANQQLTDANQQVQSLQGVLMELQNRGIIRIQADGTIQLRVRGRGD